MVRLDTKLNSATLDCKRSFLQFYLIVLVLRRFAGTRTRCYGFTSESEYEYEYEYEYESRETWFPKSNYSKVMILNRLKLTS